MGKPPSPNSWGTWEHSSSTLTSWATPSMSPVALPTSRWWQPLGQVEPLKTAGKTGRRKRREGCAIILVPQGAVLACAPPPSLGVLGSTPPRWVSVADSVMVGPKRGKPLLS